MTRGFLRFLRRNTIALLALFLALGGTTYAASTALIGKNTVASPQVVNGSLKTLDLSKKARAALRGQRGARGPVGAAGAAGAAGAKGATGAQGIQGVAGTARAYAFVANPGVSPSFDAQWTKNFTAISHNSTGVYCLTPAAGIDPETNPPVATVDWGSSVTPERAFVQVRTRHLTCGAGLYEIRTFLFGVSGAAIQTAAANDGIAFTVIVP